MRRIILSVLLSLLTAHQCLAELPIPVITGPSGGVPGDLLVLDASESQADHMAWTVIPELPDGRQTILVVESGRKAIIASVPGQYTVILAVSTADGVAIKQHTVTVSGTIPKPDPDDETDPEPRPVPDQFGLIRRVSQWVQDVPDRSRQQSLSEAFQKAADQAQQISDLKKVEGESRQNLSTRLVSQAIGGANNAANWNPLFVPMGDEIGRLAAEGELSTLSDYQQAWREIAEGLR